MRRRNVPCSPCSGGSSGSCDCCGIKEKLRILWDRTFGSILRINGISPDGDGDFEIEAGTNILLTQTGTGNGIRLDTTGGVSYYSAGDTYIDVDNNDLEISLVSPGQSGGVALQDDLDLVAGAVSDILDGTTTVPKATDATNAQYLGSSSSNVGDDIKPVKIVNGQAVAIPGRYSRREQITTKTQLLNLLYSVDNAIITVYDDRWDATHTYKKLTIEWVYSNPGILPCSGMIRRDTTTGDMKLIPFWCSCYNNEIYVYVTEIYPSNVTELIITLDDTFIQSAQYVFVMY